MSEREKPPRQHTVKAIESRPHSAEWRETAPRPLQAVPENYECEDASEMDSRFRQIYDKAPVMMHSIDKDGVIRNLNRKWLAEMGYTRDDRT
jgi:PAS domain-containing protein